MEPQISYIALSLYFLTGFMILYILYSFIMEGRGSDRAEDEAVRQHLKYKATFGNTSDLIDLNIVDQIWRMPADPPKAKGDALELFTVRLYKAMDYDAWTVDELKRMGRNAPYDLTKLTGYDQGGDVIAEKTWFEEVKDDEGNISQIKKVERLIIQCKAYAKFNEETSNSVVQQTLSAKIYYESLCNVKFDKAIIISTAEFLSTPAMDLAKHGNVDVILQQKLKELVGKANWNIRIKAQELEKSPGLLSSI